MEKEREALPIYFDGRMTEERANDLAEVFRKNDKQGKEELNGSTLPPFVGNPYQW